MTLYIVDVSRYQVERPDPLDLTQAHTAGIRAVNIALDRGKSTDELSSWAPGYASKARELGMGVCTYRWLDNRMNGADSARRAYDRMVELGGPSGMAHAVDCEDNASEQQVRDYVITMTGLLGRPLALYTGDWWWTAAGRNWHMADIAPYLWTAPNSGYLPGYPGDPSPSWHAGYCGWSDLAVMQYMVGPLPGTGDCSLSALRDPLVWSTLTGGTTVTVPTTSRTNPNPQRISGPLWWLVCKCTDATSTAFESEYGGTWMRKPGSHADAGWLVANYPGDYSLQGSAQHITTGPLSAFGRAFDWTFPSAQGGDWSQIGTYSQRIANAWSSGDPRMYGVFEILCQTPEDSQPEGYVWYPQKKFRVPDDTHKWHMHMGILTQYINDQTAMEALWSVLSGQPLSSWQDGGDNEMDTTQAAQLANCDQANWLGGSDMGPPVPTAYRLVPTGQGNAHNDRLFYIQGMLEKLATTQGPADWTSEDMAQFADKLAAALAAADNGLPSDVEALKPAMVEAVKQAIREGVGTA